ncbi:hypothetical protein BGZ76_002549 [Entomortierella beljakovae]|nr:hypothetical protein BGZ76_002549 [Entomortierella beljakovae]
MSGLFSFTKLAFAAPRLTMATGVNTLAARAYATKKIFIGNIPWRTPDEEVKDFFSQYGELKDFHAPKDFDGNTKGFAFIEMEDDLADKVLQEADGQEFNGRNIRVSPAADRERPPRREGGDDGFRQRRDGGEGGYRRRDGGEGGYRQRREGGDFRRGGRRDDYGGRDNRRGGEGYDRPRRSDNQDE